MHPRSKKTSDGVAGMGGGLDVHERAVSGMSRGLDTSDGVVVGMSGGVDSSSAAWMLAAEGRRVVGVTLRLYCYARAVRSPRPCCSEAALRDARMLCSRLGIPHRVVDVEADFERMVISNFIREYRRGRTPNPCIVCNEKVKFPALARVADRLGYRSIATGHYARLVRGSSRGARVVAARRGSSIRLAAARDAAKDQSYFLYRVPVRILERTLFPLGEATKADVKRMAASLGIQAAHGLESQDVCFLPEGDLGAFLTQRIGPRPGDVVDRDGNVLGRHEGVHHHTIGQRKGLGIARGKPLYIESIDAAARRIVLAPKEEVFHSIAVCGSLKLRSSNLDGPLMGKVRYRKPLAEVASAERRGARLTVVFKEPQWAITPGQSLVLYCDGVVVGGGIIIEGRKEE